MEEKSEGLVPSEELVRRRYQVYLQGLSPLKIETKSLLKVKDLLSQKDVQWKNEICFLGRSQFNLTVEEFYKTVFLCGLLESDRKKYELRNAYYFLEVYLGHDLYRNSVLGIATPILLVTLGFDEMENRRQEDILLQVLSDRRQFGLYSWIFFYGNSTEMQSKYPRIYQYFNYKVSLIPGKERSENVF